MVYLAESALAADVAIVHSPSSQLRVQKADDQLCLCGTVSLQDLLAFIQDLIHLVLLGFNEQDASALSEVLLGMESEEVESRMDVGDSRLLLRKLYTDNMFQMLGNFSSEMFGFLIGLADGNPVVGITRDGVYTIGNSHTPLHSLTFPAETLLAKGVQNSQSHITQ
jgi:hypothetical protein